MIACDAMLKRTCYSNVPTLPKPKIKAGDAAQLDALEVAIVVSFLRIVWRPQMLYHSQIFEMPLTLDQLRAERAEQ